MHRRTRMDLTIRGLSLLFFTSLSLFHSGVAEIHRLSGSLGEQIPSSGLRRPKTTKNRADICGETQTIDFNNFESGDVIDETVNFPDGVTIRAKRKLDPSPFFHDGMVFDTENITGDDTDLGHFKFLKKIFIISEDNDSSDADDAAGGGEIIIDFGSQSNVQLISIRFIDFDREGSDVGLFGRLDKNDDHEDPTKLSGFKIPPVANGGQRELHMGETGIQLVRIRLVGSGALDDIRYRRCDF